jgi:hypothetical protein
MSIDLLGKNASHTTPALGGFFLSLFEWVWFGLAGGIAVIAEMKTIAAQKRLVG